jgi:hypothetical protein
MGMEVQRLWGIEHPARIDRLVQTAFEHEGGY